MCILPRVSTPVPPTAPASACPAHGLPPAQRQELAVAALAGVCPVSRLAQAYQVSRKFVYQQAGKAEQALTDALPLTCSCAADAPSAWTTAPRNCSRVGGRPTG